VLGAISVVSGFWRAAGDVKARQALALGATLKAVGSIYRAVYRASRGHLGGTFQGGPVLLLTTIGRRPGQQPSRPLCDRADGTRLILVASAGGAPYHPGWYLNLQTDPRVTVRTGVDAQTMRARTATGDEQIRLWARVIQRYPICAVYQRRTTQLLP